MLDMGFKPAVDRIVAADAVQPPDALLLGHARRRRRAPGEGVHHATPARHVHQPDGRAHARASSTASCTSRTTRSSARSSASCAASAAGRTLVFVRTKRGADRLVKRLDAHDVRAVAMHGNKSQSQREKALAGFQARPRQPARGDRRRRARHRRDGRDPGHQLRRCRPTATPTSTGSAARRRAGRTGIGREPRDCRRRPATCGRIASDLGLVPRVRPRARRRQAQRRGAQWRRAKRARARRLAAAEPPEASRSQPAATSAIRTRQAGADRESSRNGGRPASCRPASRAPRRGSRPPAWRPCGARSSGRALGRRPGSGSASSSSTPASAVSACSISRSSVAMRRLVFFDTAGLPDWPARRRPLPGAVSACGASAARRSSRTRT